MEAAGREAPAAPAAEALLSLGSDVRVGMGRDRASRLADSYVGLHALGVRGAAVNRALRDAGFCAVPFQPHSVRA